MYKRRVILFFFAYTSVTKNGIIYIRVEIPEIKKPIGGNVMNEVIKLLTPLVVAATEWFTNGTKFVDKIQKSAEIALTLAISEINEKEPYQVVSAQEDLDDLEIELTMLQGDSVLINKIELMNKFKTLRQLDKHDEDQKDEYETLKKELSGLTDPHDDYKVVRRSDRIKELPEEIEMATLKLARIKKRAEIKKVQKAKTVESFNKILDELKS